MSAPSTPSRNPEDKSGTQSPTSPSQTHHKVDRYGWYVDENKEVSPQEKKLREKDSKIEQQRVDEWMKMYNNWIYYSGKGREKLCEFIRHGIPDSCRERAWKIILQPDFLNPLADTSVDLDSLINKGATSVWRTIEADLDRTMPNCPMFYNDKCLNSLRRILKAYSNQDPELGYTQGMSFIAAMLLLYLDENTAYNCFAKLMSGEKHLLRNHFLPGFPRYKEILKIWDVVFRAKYPKVHEHLLRLNCDSNFYTPSWFLTGFLNVEFPPIIRLHIFDCWIEFGSRALLSFALVIISRNKKALVSDPFELILPNLQNPQNLPTMQDWRYLLKKYDKLWISEKDYIKYCNMAKVPAFP
ncbi:TBC domain containing protein [Trichomonas vaginalis G3]|uniref:TBC domain containing protein n=1 Tax=Trichomonas vaginalis (strain ATCC PRA-98 / G3) TaxID=412133 RepID=A2DSN7_TRIV3|nr:regulation of vesicle fusion [Trichomonas vaginalis G3]EAY16617.1 TBC domain containing protein [Trichomonas vaginalis G3]KAI5532994.1 regulation of vesicle fusion [Trichomonas vaginalis G3]|eukprot:XP_001328840.1 TBC domain containing protein [Trichomonas vaginalis G3]